MSSATITVFCYVRNYSELDYKDSIRHDSSGCPPEVVQTFQETHTAFANNHWPADSTLLGFPLTAESLARPYYCLCQCKTIRVRQDRGSVRLIGVATEVEELNAKKISPDMLLNAVANYGWDKIETEQRPTLDLTIAVRAPTLVPKDSIDAFATHFKQSREMKVRSSFNPVVMFCTVARSLRNNGLDLLETAFAVSLPEKIKLPITPEFVVSEELDAPIEKTESRVATSPQDYRKSLNLIATAFAESQHIDSYWRNRLWNQCQDVIESAYACKQAWGFRNNWNRKRHERALRQRLVRLISQRDQLIITNHECAAETDKLWRQFQQWILDYRKDFHIPTRPPFYRDQHREEPRTDRTEAVIFGVIIVILVVVIGWCLVVANRDPHDDLLAPFSSTAPGTGDNMSTGDASAGSDAPGDERQKTERGNDVQAGEQKSHKQKKKQ